MGEVVRIGSVIIFYLSKLWKAKSSLLCDNISGEAAGEIGDWSPLGLKGLMLIDWKFIQKLL